jgi:hypothetical protein
MMPLNPPPIWDGYGRGRWPLAESYPDIAHEWEGFIGMEADKPFGILVEGG